jgi:hypothetical protein
MSSSTFMNNVSILEVGRFSSNGTSKDLFSGFLGSKLIHDMTG